MVDYSLTIRNQSGNTQSFSVLQAAPDGSPNGTLTTVFQSAPQIDGHGRSEVIFSLPSKYFGFAGTAQPGRQGNLRIAIDQALPAKLGPQGSKFKASQSSGHEPTQLNEIDQSVDTAGAFSFVTDDSFRNTDPRRSPYIGVGVQDPSSEDIVPIFAIQARPNTEAKFVPKPKYYVVCGRFETGTSVSLQELGNVLTVDFAALGRPRVAYTLDPSGQFVSRS